MEIEKLIFALQETISQLRQSEPSLDLPMPVAEIIRRLENEITKARNSKLIDVDGLERLFAPTGVIQQISIKHGWGTKFLRISEVIDEFTR